VILKRNLFLILGNVPIQPLKFFNLSMAFSKKFVTKIEMKKVTVIFMHHFSCDRSRIQDYRIVGVAKAAGAEALPKPPGA
jgi:hypothetical protein